MSTQPTQPPTGPNPPKPPQPSTWAEVWPSFFTAVTWLRLVVTTVLVTAVAMIWRVASDVTFDKLGEPLPARGLITFTITVCTIALAFVLILRSLFGPISPDETEAFEKRFQNAREVMGVFAGILGTIVGFYFGATREPGDRLTVTPPRLVGPVGNTLTFAQYISGGVKPYRYVVTVKTNVLLGRDGAERQAERVSTDGWITWETARRDKAPTVEVKVTDARERSVSWEDEIADAGPAAESPLTQSPAAPTPTPPIGRIPGPSPSASPAS